MRYRVRLYEWKTTKVTIVISISEMYKTPYRIVNTLPVVPSPIFRKYIIEPNTLFN